MKRALLAAAFALSACAPTRTASTAPAPTSNAPLQAAFSDAGVLWSVGGRAYLARAPLFQVETVGLPAPAGAVAWQGTGPTAVPWVALPAYGLIVTASGAPKTVQVGRVAALSGATVYRQDGTAVGFDGQPDGARFPGGPSMAVTGGDGQDYGLVAGGLYRVGEALPLDPAARPFLYATPSGAATANAPTISTPQGTYQLSGGELLHFDLAGVLRGRVKSAGVALGLIGGRLAVLGAEGRLGFYGFDLTAR